MTLGGLLISTCTIERNDSTSKDTLGNPVPSWITLAAAVPCRFSGLSSSAAKRREFIVDKKTVVAEMVVFMDYRAVTEKDRIVFSGEVYDILFVDNPSGLNHHLELYVKLVRG